MKKNLFFLVLCILPFSVFSIHDESDTPTTAELSETTDSLTETETGEVVVTAPVQTDAPVPEPEEFFFPDLSSENREETPESLRLQLEENTKNYIMYKTLQFTSVGITALGILMVILDAFIETGSEYPYTPIPTDDNPNPTAVTTAFGNLSISGAVVTAVGTAASIGFQFPYRKYRNRQYLLQNRIRNLEKIDEAETGLEEIIKEVITD